MGTDQTVPAISVVVPLLDEEGSVAELAQTLDRVLAGIGSSYEIIFVDVGSADASFSILEEQSRRLPAVSVVQLRRNFGKSTALDVGFKLSRGRILVTLDAEMLPGWLAGKSLPAMTVAQAIEDPAVQASLVKATQRANRAVSRAESIRRIRLLDIDLTEANGYLTPSLKVKRAVVHRDFSGPIEEIYAKGGAALDVPAT